MRVLHVHSGNLYGGVETLLLTLARRRELAPRIEPHYALCFDGRLRDELREARAAVHALGGVRVSRPLSMRRARRALRELLSTYRFDAVVTHAPWSHAIFGPVARAEGLPLAFWMHGPASGGTHWLERWARLTPPDVVLCNSEYTAKDARRFFPRGRAELVYCPVEAPTVQPTPSERAAVRAELDTPEGATVIVQASRMEPWKGHRTHLDALGLLKDVPGWVCWFVGGGQRPREAAYLRELQGQAARLGIAERVRFAGQRSDVPRLLAAADIYCQPNAEPEPFGIAFVEALYAGLPVVTTDEGGAVEIVDESCGTLVQPGDAGALAESLRALIENPLMRAALGRRAPARATELCEPATQMRRIEDILRGLARRREAA
ncbi:MAG TPA: glycosyltransferase [Pyrinomonadaceae bacterium]